MFIQTITAFPGRRDDFPRESNRKIEKVETDKLQRRNKVQIRKPLYERVGQSLDTKK